MTERRPCPAALGPLEAWRELMFNHKSPSNLGVRIGGETRFYIRSRILPFLTPSPALLLTHRFSLDDAPRAFEVAASRSEGAIKVGIHP